MPVCEQTQKKGKWPATMNLVHKWKSKPDIFTLIIHDLETFFCFLPLWHRDFRHNLQKQIIKNKHHASLYLFIKAPLFVFCRLIMTPSGMSHTPPQHHVWQQAALLSWPSEWPKENWRWDSIHIKWQQGRCFSRSFSTTRWKHVEKNVQTDVQIICSSNDVCLKYAVNIY